jgi:hypothetical protein
VNSAYLISTILTGISIGLFALSGFFSKKAYKESTALQKLRLDALSDHGWAPLIPMGLYVILLLAFPGLSESWGTDLLEGTIFLILLLVGIVTYRRYKNHLATLNLSDSYYNLIRVSCVLDTVGFILLPVSFFVSY